MEMKDVQRVWEIDVASFSLPWPERSYRFEIEQNPASHCYVIEISQGEEPPVVAGGEVQGIRAWRSPPQP